MKKVQIAWIILIFIGIFLRLFDFGSIPAALNRDEAALGYNAFAITYRGIDEWGKSYPLLFKSFGDYKLPGYIYLLSGFIKIFGVNDIVVRLPSLLAGLWIIGLTYLFVFELTKNKNAALLTTAVVSLQPWAIFYSRMAYEANLGLSLFLTGLLWALKFLKNGNKQFLLLFGLFYLLAIFSYNSPLILAPALILCLWVYEKTKIKQKIWLTTLIVLISVFAFLILSPVTSQKQGITIFSDPTVTHLQTEGYSQSNSVLNRLWWNRYIYRIRRMTKNALNSFDPNFLLTNGGANPWHSVPGKSHLFFTTYTLFIVSLFLFIRNHSIKTSFVLLFALVGSLLPAIITVDAPHATRSLFFFWLVSLLSVYSLYIKRRGNLLILFLLLIESVWWGYLNFIDYPASIKGNAWPIGISSALKETGTDYHSGKRVIIRDLGNGSVVDDQVYIYPLLYYKVDPLIYLKTAHMSPPDISGMIRVNGFERVSLSKNEADGNAIIIERDQNGKYAIK